MKNLIDEIGKANLTDTFNSSVGNFDRFCNRSAIDLNCGSAKIPTGVYFSGDFTLSFWLYLKLHRPNSTLIVFGSNASSVYISLNGISPRLEISIINQLNSSFLASKTVIAVSRWYFLTFVLNDITGFIYINENLDTNGTLLVPRGSIRNRNYIGKYRSVGNCSYFVMDDLKIYEGAMFSEQIKDEYIDCNFFF